ncbi:MAG: hypothetical protein AB7P24_07770 [Nitrospira sp.]
MPTAGDMLNTADAWLIHATRKPESLSSPHRIHLSLETTSPSRRPSRSNGTAQTVSLSLFLAAGTSRSRTVVNHARQTNSLQLTPAVRRHILLGTKAGPCCVVAEGRLVVRPLGCWRRN